MSAELIIGQHHFIQVVGASGTDHGLHCIRCGMDPWRRCKRCSVIITPTKDSNQVGRRTYCTPQCRRKAAAERRKAEKEQTK